MDLDCSEKFTFHPVDDKKRRRNVHQTSKQTHASNVLEGKMHCLEEEKQQKPHIYIKNWINFISQ